MKKTAITLLAALTALAALIAGVFVMTSPAHAEYESKRLDMKVSVRCTDDGATLVVIRLRDTRPKAPEDTPPKYRPSAITWKHSDDGAPWNTWSSTEPLAAAESIRHRFRIEPGQWLRVAVSDETDTRFARKLMLDRRFVPRDC